MAVRRALSGSFPVGTFVKHQGPAGADPEYGVVVQSACGGSGGLEYYVACFGASHLPGQPTSAPYMNRLLGSSLERVEHDPRRPIWERQRKPGFAEKLKKSRVFWAFIVLLKAAVTVALVVMLIQRSSCH